MEETSTERASRLQVWRLRGCPASPRAPQDTGILIHTTHRCHIRAVVLRVPTSHPTCSYGLQSR